MSVDKIDKEYSYRYIEDNEGHPSIEILRDGTRETDFEKSWLSMHLEIKNLTLTKTLRSEPNEKAPETIAESDRERLSGAASLGEDSIGLIYTKKKTSKIEVTFYEHKEEGSTSQRANKYYLSGYPDDDESNLDCPAGTYFLNIFLSTTRFNELKELVLNNGVEKIYVSVRTGVLPNLYNEFTTGDWPTVFRYLDNRKFLENPDDMPETVLAKGTIREGGYECEITFSRQPMFRAPVEAAKSNDIVEADEEALYAEEKPRNAHGSQAPISREPILINMSKVALPIWALVIIYGFSQFFG